MDELKDNAQEYAAFDWNLQQKHAGLSHNPIYHLIINSFKEVYLRLAKSFFFLKIRSIVPLQENFIMNC
ncbi:hypothetical protein [Fictibacillus sp. FJAT-27399]|uniref:hypothetical protein n=1 Tax=Fictibacillus sp. FJAT-27399 TaxID=1729689 RepID=UPI000780E81C